MRIAVLYVAVVFGPRTLEMASRFACTLHQFPAGTEHSLFLVCNGGPPPLALGNLFLAHNAQIYTRQNDAGWDVSAYVDFARDFGKDYDLQVCLGESVFFHRPGWLAKLKDAREKCGPGMFGIYSSCWPRPFLSTTAFAVSPEFLVRYPYLARSKEQRYEFEHGENSLCRYISKLGYVTNLVTWDGIWCWADWRAPSDILWRGDQSNCLMFCNHTEAYRKCDAYHRQKWSLFGDGHVL